MMRSWHRNTGIESGKGNAVLGSNPKNSGPTGPCEHEGRDVAREIPRNRSRWTRADANGFCSGQCDEDEEKEKHSSFARSIRDTTSLTQQ